MSCFHPLKAFPIGTTVAGKVQYKIVGYKADHLEFVNGSWIVVHNQMRGAQASRVVRDWIEIPCGKCVGCRLDYSRQWADRCMLELQDSNSAYFLTLTYDDQHLPRSVYADPDTGEAMASYTLRKDEFQKFMKRLRYYFGDNIRFFACGEYGSRSFRPHYHAIVYNIRFDDLQFYKKSETGDFYYNSPKLDRAWKAGFAVIGEVTWQSCAYVARYCMKKAQGVSSETYAKFNIEPEFTLMSRRPGIGRHYLDAHPDLYKFDKISITTEKGGKDIMIPKYFDRITAAQHPELIETLKARRKENAEARMQQILSQTDLDYLDYLKVCEDNKIAKIKSLRRIIE